VGVGERGRAGRKRPGRLVCVCVCACVVCVCKREVPAQMRDPRRGGRVGKVANEKVNVCEKCTGHMSNPLAHPAQHKGVG